jgi:hypothetical protein
MKCKSILDDDEDKDREISANGNTFYFITTSAEKYSRLVKPI